MAGPVEVWTVRIPEPGTAERTAERAEAAGWDGIAYTDSQNLIGDPFVAVALGAKVTERLRFGTAVTNVATREPAALASVAATVQETSGGRMVLGVGRGDTALFHLGRPPQPLRQFEPRLRALQTYLGGGTVDCDGFESRIRWLDRARQPKVPLDIAASGPKVIALSAEVAERTTFAVGADPDRLRWALALARQTAPAGHSFGAFVNVGCDPDLDAARSMVAGSVAAFAHFSSMPGSTQAGLEGHDREIVAEVGRAYDSNLHLVNSAPHTAPLEAQFVDRFAVVGSPARCVERLLELRKLGLDRFVLTGASFGTAPAVARAAEHRVVEEVLPALRAAARR